MDQRAAVLVGFPPTLRNSCGRRISGRRNFESRRRKQEERVQADVAQDAHQVRDPVLVTIKFSVGQ